MTWEGAETLLNSKLSELCTDYASTDDNQGSERCASNLIGQAQAYLVAACARSPDDSCANPTPLDELCKLEGTDKSSYYHDFAAFYDQQLARLRPESILEIGVKRGASLRAWANKYPCAQIRGLDNFADPDCHPRGTVIPGRFTVGEVDQSSFHGLQEATRGERYDLIIDDGGHTMRQQQTTLAALWGLVRPCGAFIVEDLHTSLRPSASDQYRPTTLQVVAGEAASTLVDFWQIQTEASSIEIFGTNADHITAVLHKKCDESPNTEPVKN
jgi:hypothetical protein